MGQWVLYAGTRSGDIYRVNANYVNAHDGIGMTASSGKVTVGQDYNNVAPFVHTIWRGGFLFKTGQMPDVSVVNSAKLQVEQYAGGTVPTDAMWLYLVRGSNLQDPLNVGDYQELLAEVVSRGQIYVPASPGLWDGVYHDIVLNALGIADLIFIGDTWFGIRNQHDIGSTPEDVNDLNHILFPETDSDGLKKLIQNEGAYHGYNYITFTTDITDGGLSLGSRMPRLVLDVVAAGLYTNLRARFQYGVAFVTEYSTPWQEVSYIGETLNKTVTEGVSPGDTYKCRVQLQVDDTAIGTGGTFTTPAAAPLMSKAYALSREEL